MIIELNPNDFDLLREIFSREPSKEEEAFVKNVRLALDNAAKLSSERDQRDRDIAKALQSIDETIDKSCIFEGSTKTVDSLRQFRYHLLRAPLIDKMRDLLTCFEKWEETIDYPCEFKNWMMCVHEHLQAGVKLCQDVYTLDRVDRGTDSAKERFECEDSTDCCKPVSSGFRL